MRIEEDIKLDFKDVLIRPKRSALSSRIEVDLLREYRFLHNNSKWLGVPIIASNMDHTGTFKMATSLSKHQLLTAINKFATLKEWQNFKDKNILYKQYTLISTGTSETNNDFKNLCTIMNDIDCSLICLDVANGYTQHFVNSLKKIPSLNIKNYISNLVNLFILIFSPILSIYSFIKESIVFPGFFIDS